MNLKSLEQKLGIKFKNRHILDTALTHRSYLNEQPEYKGEHNERLEFLGDAVLEFLVTHYLFTHYPQAAEGELTSIRAAVVSTKSLGRIGRKLDLGSYLKMARGEENGGGRTRLSALADTFEALLGAAFIDSGWENPKKILSKTIFPIIPVVVAKGSYRDAKSLLQEKTQAQFKISPKYELLAESGPDHQKLFTVGVLVNQKLLSTGQGRSKQEAEENAARNGLKKYDKIISDHLLVLKNHGG